MKNTAHTINLPYPSYFADMYSCSGYGSSMYNSSADVAAGANCRVPTTSNTGSLVDTGIVVAVIVTAACMLGLLAIMIRVWRRPKRLRSTDGDVVRGVVSDVQ